VSKDDVAWEAADVMYFVFVAMIRSGVSLHDGLSLSFSLSLSLSL